MIDYSKPVRVFKNPKHNCYSILQDGRLKASARQVRLSEVEFRVRESGRQRMLREKRRVVHAFAVGKLEGYIHPSEEHSMDSLQGRDVFYDPYRFDSFVDRETEAPVKSATTVQLDERGVVYC